jgi:flagellar biosynthesis protein
MSVKHRYTSAVGLGFSEGGSGSPIVTVKGEQSVADAIVKLAKSYNIPVIEKPALSDALNEVPLDTEIPPVLYEAAAALLLELDLLR